MSHMNYIYIGPYLHKVKHI